MVTGKGRWSGIVALLGCALLVAACSRPDAEKTVEEVGFGISEPARYTVGDSFTFDNPTLTWFVVSVEGERVYWRTDRGDEQVTGHNPLLPALEWKNPNQGGGRRVVSDIKGSLFPLKINNRMTFTSEVESWNTGDLGGEPQTWQYGWVCNVAGEENISVQAGTFDTFKILCGRAKQDELIFYYAPRIGHYVVMRIDDTKTEGKITRNLLSFRRVALGGEIVIPPPPSAPPPPSPEVEPIPEPEPKKLPPPEPPKPTAAVPGKGPRAVFGAFVSEENAARAWGIYRKKHGNLLSDLKPQITPVKFRDKGTLFRLATDRLESRTEADDLCRKIIAQGSDCVVSNK